MTPLGRLRQRVRDDRGLSLTELLVGSAVLVMLLPLAGAMFHGALVTQRDVRAVTEATTTAQAAVASLEAGVRNAAAIRRTTAGAGGTDELLVVRTRVAHAGSGAWECRAWFYDSAKQQILSRTSPVAIAAPDTSTASQWTTLAERVAPPAPGTPVTVLTGQSSLDVSFSVGTGTDRKPVLVSTSITRRPQNDIKGTPCF